MEIFEVIQPGAYTTVQDRGRFGYQQFGVPICGVVDSFAYRLANALVGNTEGEAVLEATVVGPTLKVLDDSVIAMTGGDLWPLLNDASFPMWESIAVHPGDTIRFKGVRSGCRTYVAVAGGIDVPVVMGSRSTYVAGKIGGIEGRPLAEGDRLKRGQGTGKPGIRIPSDLIPTYPDEIEVRVILGPQDDFFAEGTEKFLSSTFKVSSKADRMGYRLEGDPIMHKEGVTKSIISEPSVPGGIQVPPDGQPIILLVEQTVGGYTKIATVVSSDIGKVGQAKPGNRIRFQKVGLEEAHTALTEEEEKTASVYALGDL
ncbi:MAG: 5-oxoprolinase/urea amidolyase family protein [Proteobacteria bacterium]|nr:5-oxoprolinase/urea amidolyase family protein [Pseudomonadota bacterium]NIS70792.1 5-oxoprolinase/urea amidolyase family protein [Pseudomonadota bacterium]